MARAELVGAGLGSRLTRTGFQFDAKGFGAAFL